MKPRTTAAVAAALLAGALVGGAVEALAAGSSSTTGASSAAKPTASPPRVAATSGPFTPEEVYKSDAPGVVEITATETQKIPGTFFTPPTKEQVGVLGSGFVIDRKGDIVTNDHVVQGATSLRVGFSNGAGYPAKIVGTDPSTDLAVVRVDASASALDPLPWGNSGAAQVGDSVYAIGNPFGLDRTMTAGIVSATGRAITAPNGLSIDHAIQTDAAINHGNSGGPLVNREGRVIGVDSQIDTGGTSDGNVGIGFAVPSDTAQQIVRQLITNGHAAHAWLGVEVATVDRTVAGSVKGVPARGVLVVRIVPGSPAAKAGLVAGNRQVTVNGVSAVVGGDAIVSFDGKPIASADELAAAVAAHRPGDRITLGTIRKGHERTVNATLANAPRNAT